MCPSRTAYNDRKLFPSPETNFSTVISAWNHCKAVPCRANQTSVKGKSADLTSTNNSFCSSNKSISLITSVSSAFLLFRPDQIMAIIHTDRHLFSILYSLFTLQSMTERLVFPASLSPSTETTPSPLCLHTGSPKYFPYFKWAGHITQMEHLLES